MESSTNKMVNGVAAWSARIDIQVDTQIPISLQLGNFYSSWLGSLRPCPPPYSAKA